MTNLSFTNNRNICYILSLYARLRYFRARFYWGYLKVTYLWVLCITDGITFFF